MIPHLIIRPFAVSPSKHILLFMLINSPSLGQLQEVNYDESKVPDYTLPDPLLLEDSTPVSDASMWPVRRTQILDLFAEHVYGKTPLMPIRAEHVVRSENPNALNGLATRRQVSILFGEQGEQQLDLLIYLPNEHASPHPTFFGLNFDGNHTIHTDTDIFLPAGWVRNDTKTGATNNRATANGRGSSMGRWPVELVLARGYALVTAYYGDLDPDFDDGFRNGVHRLFSTEKNLPRSPTDWGSIGAWAWGLSRAMDYFEMDDEIDHNKVAVVGHSRLGKATLWAGAQDERFGIVISNNSGCGGAALFRRRIGETIAHITSSFPHWFSGRFAQYSGMEDTLPIDQHMLLALIAPRPVYVASADQDHWADPQGEFLATEHVGPVYNLLGQEKSASVGYHIRPGTHDLTEYDWNYYLDFADVHFQVDTRQ